MSIRERVYRMQSFCWFLILSSFFLITPQATAASETDASALMRRYRLNPANVSFEVIPITERSTANAIISHQAHTLRNPASTLKILTSAVALERLGPSFRFKTEAYVTAPVVEGELKGDVILKGYGDPSMVTEQLWRLVLDLRNRGLKKINGQVLGDVSYFQSRAMRTNFSKSRPYNSELSPLALNYNHIQLWVQPTTKGQPIVVRLDPDLDSFVHILNRGQTVSGKTKAINMEWVKNPKGLDLRVSGKLGDQLNAEQFYHPVLDAPEYFLHSFVDLFKKSGGIVTGGVRIASVPKGASLFYTKESELFLSQILVYLNKYSNNFIADQLLLQIGARTKSDDATAFESGLSELSRYLESLHVAKPEAQLFNGSGLSRKNRIHATHLNAILAKVWSEPRIRSEFIASLSALGSDGTLEKWRGFNAHVRAKSGSLNGVSALTGYIFDDVDSPLAFSILVNQNGIDRNQMRQFQRDLLNLALMKFKEPTT